MSSYRVQQGDCLSSVAKRRGFDWKTIWAALKATKARHFVVEHDNPNDIKRCASRSIASIKAF